VAWKRIESASPLVFLMRLGLLEILNEPGVAVEVPGAVLAELSHRDPTDPAAVAARSTHWIKVVPTPPTHALIRPSRLDAGEASVFSLALADVQARTAATNGLDVVLDDAKARRARTAWESASKELWPSS
jgi:hypothetical protein